MQTVHPGSDAVPQGAVPQTYGGGQAAYVQEVRSLRQRVAVLEAELAAAKAAEQLSKTPPLTSIDFAPAAPAAAPAEAAPQPAVSHPEPPSVFTESVAPAVVAVLPHAPEQAVAKPAPTGSQPPEPSPTEPMADTTPVPNPGFAEAWGREPDATFAEKVAEKAFFQATSVDEQSRSWLLDS